VRSLWRNRLGAYERSERAVYAAEEVVLMIFAAEGAAYRQSLQAV
jgi:hypothetical protein